MMPAATSPGANVFATGCMRIQWLLRAGFALNVARVAPATLTPYALISRLG